MLGDQKTIGNAEFFFYNVQTHRSENAEAK